ncbi:hypothetical protein Mucpa_5161 [Mucilaginibacter paludis DSM 18603]|uniref:Uncharacterized protein n=1 Tax=Mucilaginibacter paludis DSM 18603 TaxID=714943 RepID=H1Y381_9SPHI|nr:hypothetical protein Mucpa_5161 [Mucilaginibacter paludis DSM 18603]
MLDFDRAYRYFNSTLLVGFMTNSVGEIFLVYPVEFEAVILFCCFSDEKQINELQFMMVSS